MKASSLVPNEPSTEQLWRLGATSFVHPGSWAFNVEKLGKDFDDIEILFFEGAPSDFPSAHECAQLLELRQRHELSYCLHTPLSASLASANDERRRQSVGTIERAVRAAELFIPEHVVLHVYLGDKEHDPNPPSDLNAWRDRARQSLSKLCQSVEDPRQLCVESIDYDIEMLAPVIEELNLSYALDIGHWVRDGRDTLGTLKRLLPRTRLIQWHGTDPNDRDHRSLRHYPDELGRHVLRLLRQEQYQGVVTLEVFRAHDLSESLAQLQLWQAQVCEPSLSSTP